MNQPRLDRRHLFLGSAALAGVAATPNLVPAVDPIPRSGTSTFRVGLAAYSLRNYFPFMKGKPRVVANPVEAIDMVKFLDYCNREGFEAAELTSYFFPPDAGRDYFLELKRQAFIKGVTISGTAIGNNFTIGAGEKLEQEIAYARAWIENASYLGAPHIRFFAGTGDQLDKHPERMAEAVDAMKQCATTAADKGIFLGIENHGNLRPDQLLPLIHAVDHPWVGINLDTGNFYSDDPYGDLEQCAPYAVNVQVKAAMRKPDKTKYPADFDRIAGILKDSGYQGFVILEYEEDEPYDNIPAVADRLRKALGV